MEAVQGPDQVSSSAPRRAHEERRSRYEAEQASLDARQGQLSLARLACFLGAVVIGVAGVSQASLPMIGGGALLVVVFFLLVAVHAKVIGARDLARIRRDVHVRHLQRLDGAWMELPSTGEGLAPKDHPYAFDLDLMGPGSLFQRLDVTHTVRGERTLATWLGEAASSEVARARQEAVRELAKAVEFRQELEASAEIAGGQEALDRLGKLDPAPFLEFTQTKAFVTARPWLTPLLFVLPPVTVGLSIASLFDLVPQWAFGIGVLAQSALFLWSSKAVLPTLDLISARRRFAEAYARIFETIEGAEVHAPALVSIKERLAAGGVAPSSHMRRLDRWAGFAELRTNVLIHFPANVFLLWDLHVVRGLERWNESVGSHMDDIFEAVGELEALASLATLAGGDPTATFPDLVDGAEPFEATLLAHPLLTASARVANDVSLRGAGTALIVTGSNMAGKSTLLRAIGLNLALAYAGGPVIAGSMKAPRVRLRASMRANDDLQRGASYFHAELTKLRGVVVDADDEEAPPIFFLLDELLRGTNARARHIGARSVLMHLLDRRGTGVVATHDVALAKLEEEHPDRVQNAHFTDVMKDGEMYFDYRLKEGVVKSSNALRLLKMAGIDVPDDDSPID